MINNFEISKKDKPSPSSKKSEDINIAELVNEYIEAFLSHKENNSKTKLIEFLDTTNKNLQRCVSKPENKNDFIKDEKLLEFLNKNTDNVRLLIKLFTKRSNEQKLNANANFSQTENNHGSANTSPTKINIASSLLSESSQTNYFFLESFTDKEISFNFIYFIIIHSKSKSVDFFTLDNELKLSYSDLHIISENSKTSWLSEIFERNIEDYIEDKHTCHILNLQKLHEDVNNINKSNALNALNTLNLIEDFKVNKKILSKDFLEEMKNLFIEKELHKNFISTNNVKFMKKMCETGFSYYCYPNQIKEFK